MSTYSRDAMLHDAYHNTPGSKQAHCKLCRYTWSAYDGEMDDYILNSQVSCQKQLGNGVERMTYLLQSLCACVLEKESRCLQLVHA